MKVTLPSRGSEKHSVLSFGIKASHLCFGISLVVMRGVYWREWEQNWRHEDQAERSEESELRPEQWGWSRGDRRG